MKRKPSPLARATRRTRAFDRAAAYSQFWLYTEPQRQAERDQRALILARDADDVRRARKGLAPRDVYWFKRGAVAS